MYWLFHFPHAIKFRAPECEKLYVQIVKVTSSLKELQVKFYCSATTAKEDPV